MKKVLSANDNSIANKSKPSAVQLNPSALAYPEFEEEGAEDEVPPRS